MLRTPMWRPSEGDPCCAVTRVSIGHLVEGAPAAPILLRGRLKSRQTPVFTGETQDFADGGLRQENFWGGPARICLEDPQNLKISWRPPRPEK
jgi:hypothetical protein